MSWKICFANKNSITCISLTTPPSLQKNISNKFFIALSSSSCCHDYFYTVLFGANLIFFTISSEFWIKASSSRAHVKCPQKIEWQGCLSANVLENFGTCSDKNVLSNFVRFWCGQDGTFPTKEMHYVFAEIDYFKDKVDNSFKEKLTLLFKVLEHRVWWILVNLEDDRGFKRSSCKDWPKIVVE